VQLVVVAVDHDLAFAPRALIQLVPQRGGRLACAPQSANSETEIAGDGCELFISILVLQFELFRSESNRLSGELFENAGVLRGHVIVGSRFRALWMNAFERPCSPPGCPDLEHV
jgi:hypothetical protein